MKKRGFCPVFFCKK